MSMHQASQSPPLQVSIQNAQLMLCIKYWNVNLCQTLLEFQCVLRKDYPSWTVFCFFSHSVSERCILNMDHYCPWMRNCVGYYNYRYFVLFLFYMTLGALYVVIYTLFDVVTMTPEERWVKNQIIQTYIMIYSLNFCFDQRRIFTRVHIKMSAVFRSNIFTNLRSSTLSASMYAFSLALSAVVSAGALLIWHSYLIYTNQVSFCRWNESEFLLQNSDHSISYTGFSQYSLFNRQQSTSTWTTPSNMH